MADMTTKTPASLVKDYILAHAPAGFLNGWEIKIGKLTAEPDQVITLVDQGGPPGFPHLLVDWPGLQVLVRGMRAGDGYQTSYLKARGVRDLILGLDSHPVEFPELDGVTERGHIVPLGYDEQDRHTWSNNFQLQVEPGANAITNRTPL